MTSWHRSTFPSMGCTATVVVAGARRSLDTARAMLESLERTWSRFDPDSEISRLNAAGGAPCGVSTSTVILVRAMVDGWRVTEGGFDPTLLAPLARLGYDRSRHDGRACSCAGPGAVGRGRPDRIVIDDSARVVRLPAQTVIDPGGIGKGLAADVVAERLFTSGATGVLVDVGGDIAVRGEAPSADGWRLAVGTLDGEQLRLASGGVATSGTEHRSWVGPNGRSVHHLLDPQSLEPADTGVAEVTVVAGSAAWAEVWTKAVVVGSPTATLAALDLRRLAVRVRRTDGTIHHNATWQAFGVTAVAA
jgi:thiamine biosynthesis lipoprotein